MQDLTLYPLSYLVYRFFALLFLRSYHKPYTAGLFKLLTVKMILDHIEVVLIPISGGFFKGFKYNFDQVFFAGFKGYAFDFSIRFPYLNGFGLSVSTVTPVPVSFCVQGTGRKR